MIHQATISINFVEYKLVSTKDGDKHCKDCKLRDYSGSFCAFCMQFVPVGMIWSKYDGKEAQA